MIQVNVIAIQVNVVVAVALVLVVVPVVVDQVAVATAKIRDISATTRRRLISQKRAATSVRVQAKSLIT